MTYYVKIEEGKLIMNPKRVPATEPIVKLGEEFRTVENSMKFQKVTPAAD